jgi:hypothetical protein
LGSQNGYDGAKMVMLNWKQQQQQQQQQQQHGLVGWKVDHLIPAQSVRTPFLLYKLQTIFCVF